MRAGDRQTGFQTHEFGQHLGAAHYGNVARARGSISTLSCVTADDTVTTPARQYFPRDGRSLPARPYLKAFACWRFHPDHCLHLIAHDMHHLGNTAHANAANADNVHPPEGTQCARRCARPCVIAFSPCWRRFVLDERQRIAAQAQIGIRRASDNDRAEAAFSNSILSIIRSVFPKATQS